MVEGGIEIALAGLAFAIFLGIHVPVWMRLGAYRAGFALMVFLWALGLVAALGVARWLEIPVHVLTVIAIDGCLMAFYMHLYTGMLRSVSLRLLGELLAHDGELDPSQLAEVYSPAAMLDGRLAWLVEQGWIGETEGRYRLTPSGRRLLQRRNRLASFFVEGPTG
ncbi:MAG: hypothetical protein AAGD38_05400 [Acidobacteriota bacterium]